MNSKLIKKINKHLIKYASSTKDISLVNGKMGVAIYAFSAAREFEDPHLLELAERMVDEVVTELETSHVNDGFEDGLSGIIWGFEYLIQNRYIDPEKDALSHIDNKLFRIIIHLDCEDISITGITGYLFYLFSKTIKQDIDLESKRYYRRLIIELVNTLSYKLGQAENELLPPLSFDIQWNLPQILLVLGKISEMHIYDDKVRRIIEQLSPVVLSIFPQLHCNRLYLLWGMEAFVQLSITGWKEHISLLRNNISIEQILNQELVDKSISMKNGISGISLICSQISKKCPNHMFSIPFETLEKRISNSESKHWNFEAGDSLGILYGQAGIGLVLLNAWKNEIEIRKI